MSGKEWYYPIMSRLDQYLNVLELYGNPEDITKLPESQVYYDSCIKAEFVEKSAISTGFKGRSTSFSFELPTVTKEGVTFQRFTSESGLGMSTYFTLTDNFTYAFIAACWDDNQASWGVMSTVAKLPKETVQENHKHAESLGFKKEYFEELRYEYCNNERANTLSVEGSQTCT